MTPYPFALSLNTAIQVSAGADGYCLAPEGADTSPGVISSMVTLPSGSGIGDALAHLREGGRRRRPWCKPWWIGRGRRRGSSWRWFYRSLISGAG